MNHDQCSVKILKNSIIAVMKEEVRLVEDLILDTEINVYEMDKLLSVANNMCRNEHGVGNRRTTNLAVQLISNFGADLDDIHKDGRTPLTVAIGRYHWYGHLSTTVQMRTKERPVVIKHP
jgi:hypothetical protein